ncbi:MAG: hypothetical protein V4732_20865 [Pseudomonadota bacterium]
MKESRIYFRGNPWPEGHLIKEFHWSARIEHDAVWFDMHIETQNYYSERDIEDNEDVEYLSDWVAPIVWGNYHSCTLSTNNWHNGGFKVCLVKQYCAEFMDGLELEIDTNPEAIEDWDELAFHIYLLGHDSAAKHKLKFERIGKTNTFNIIWTGKIAQAYVGDYEYKHDFSTLISEVKLPML